jgi:hypothetical protein
MAYLRDACLSFPFLCSLRSIHAHLCFTSRAASHEPGMCSHGACLPARPVCPCSQRWGVWADSWLQPDRHGRSLFLLLVTDFPLPYFILSDFIHFSVHQCEIPVCD